MSSGHKRQCSNCYTAAAKTDYVTSKAGHMPASHVEQTSVVRNGVGIVGLEQSVVMQPRL